jgi:hypothetical protein
MNVEKFDFPSGFVHIDNIQNELTIYFAFEGIKHWGKAALNEVY